MAMGRGCKVFHNILGPRGQLVEGQAYSLVMEQRNKNEVLMFENYAIASMRKFKRYIIFLIKKYIVNISNTQYIIIVYQSHYSYN